MNKIKLFLPGLALLALFAAPPARADVGTVDLAITNTITTAATEVNCLGATNYIDKVQRIGFMFTGQCKEADSVSNLTVIFVRSKDGVTFETTPGITWTFPVNAANPFAAYTNLNVPSARAIKVLSIQSEALDDVTNAALKIIKKTVKPSP